MLNNQSSHLHRKSEYDREPDAQVFSSGAEQNGQSQFCEHMLNELGIDLDCADLSNEQKQKLI